MFDERQTKAEIIAAAAVQNDKLVAAYVEIERLRAALTVARKFVNDHGPEEPGDQSRKTNDMLALIDDALSNG